MVQRCQGMVRASAYCAATDDSSEDVSKPVNCQQPTRVTQVIVKSKSKFLKETILDGRRISPDSLSLQWCNHALEYFNIELEFQRILQPLTFPQDLRLLRLLLSWSRV